jgi:hypothetical protein
MTNDSPTRIPSIKSETENPKYSMCTKRPMRMLRAIDIIPIANIDSSLSDIPFTLPGITKYLFNHRLKNYGYHN